MKILLILAVTTTALLPSQAAAQHASSPHMTSIPVSCPQVLKAKVNLNKATLAQLQCLKSVKAATAQDIIANRPFKDGADFGKKIEDIGKKLYDLNKANVSF